MAENIIQGFLHSCICRSARETLSNSVTLRPRLILLHSDAPDAEADFPYIPPLGVEGQVSVNTPASSDTKLNVMSVVAPEG